MSTYLGVAPYDQIDISWIELDAKAPPPGSLRGEQGRPRAQERVDHDVTAVCEVKEGVLEHRDQLYGQVLLKPGSGF